MNLRTMVGIGTLALTLLGGAASLVAPGADAQSGATCQGQPATVTVGPNDVTINGTPDNDVIVGNGLDNTIFGGPGDDLICGGAGDDSVQGNDGSDRLYGGAENDILLGGDDGDKLFGEGGNDQLSGDTTSGESGVDRCDGGKGRRDALLVNDQSPKATCETKISLEKVVEI